MPSSTAQMKISFNFGLYLLTCLCCLLPVLS